MAKKDEKPLDLSDAGEVRERAREARNKDEQFEADFDAVLETPAGRRFVKRLIDDGQPLSDPFSPDAALAAYRLGKQAAARCLLVLLQQPKRFSLYQTMIVENSK